MMSDNGEEKYVTLNEAEMIADVDKIRKENGWKPRVRGSGPATVQAASATAPTQSSTTGKASKSGTFNYCQYYKGFFWL